MSIIEGHNTTIKRNKSVYVTDDNKLQVSAVIGAGTALIGKVGIDQVTANANKVVTTTGSITTATLSAETTKVIGTVNSKVADGADITQGAKADAAATVGDTTPFSVIALLKGILNKIGAASSAIIGKVGIDQTTDGVTNLVRVKGITLLNYFTSALVASGVIKNSAGALHSITITNGSTAAQYIQLHDASSLPADGAIPILSVLVQAGGLVFFDWPVYGKSFSNGIVWCNSSTQATKTIGSANCFGSATYI